mgnify:CR=1 FL=1
MNKSVTLFASVLLVAGLLAGCAAQQPEEYSDPDREIEIGVGEQFIIALESNPTTGYMWEADFEESFLTLVQDEFQPAEDKDVVGAGGERRFTFEGVKKGKAEVTLTYKRSWEEDFSDQKVFVVLVK